MQSGHNSGALLCGWWSHNHKRTSFVSCSPAWRPSPSCLHLELYFRPSAVVRSSHFLLYFSSGLILKILFPEAKFRAPVFFSYSHSWNYKIYLVLNLPVTLHRHWNQLNPMLIGMLRCSGPHSCSNRNCSTGLAYLWSCILLSVPSSKGHNSFLLHPSYLSLTNSVQQSHSWQVQSVKKFPAFYETRWFIKKIHKSPPHESNPHSKKDKLWIVMNNLLAAYEWVTDEVLSDITGK